MRIIIALLLLSTLAFAKHKCIHDTQKIELLPVDDGRTESLTPDGRKLANSFDNIRIVADYTYLTEGKAVIREYIRNQLMPSAIKYYQNALKVIPVTKLGLPATCTTGFSTPSNLQNIAADLVILVTAEKSDESYLAFAQPCGLVSNGRPSYGKIQFNLNLLKTADDVDLEENLITTLHEMAHILGFSAASYDNFIDKDTQTKLKNKLDPTTYPVKSKTVNGKTVNYLDLKPLNDKMLAHFGCAGGGLLEDEGGSGSAGSHFERRVFYNEFMTASSITDSVISQFTLAVLEGSGWYEVNYGDGLVEPFSWGANKGCDFFNTPCMKTDKSPPYPAFNEFCGTLEQEGCTYTARAVAICGTTNAKNTDSYLDNNFNYFGNETVMLDSFVDNCPYFIGYPNLDCENPSDKDYGVLNEEVYGTTSRCFVGTLGKIAKNRQTGYCFPTTCTKTSTSPVAYSLQFNVGNKIVTCGSAGSQNVDGFYGTITCPDPTAFCLKANPVYCERGCTQGTCNTATGKCQCPTGWGGADCGFRVYVDSCSRCAGETENKACFGDTCSCNPSSGICTGDQLIGVGDEGRNKDNDGGDSDDASRIGAMSGLMVFMMLAMLLL